jgi:hypothetical protein
MLGRQFSDSERKRILEAAEELGDRPVASMFGVSEGTRCGGGRPGGSRSARSWRHRAGRKVVDRRARDDQSSDDATAAPGTVDVMIPSDEWDPAAGAYRKVPAKAKVIPVGKFEMGGSFMSQGAKRELRVSGDAAAGLTVGDVVLLGGEHVAHIADSLWRIVPRGESTPTAGAPFYELERPSRSGPVFTVEPARAPRQASPPVGYASHEAYERERLANLNAQWNEQEQRRRQMAELQESWARR